MGKYTLHFTTPTISTMRRYGDIPNCTPAVDVFKVDDEGYLTIHNPAPRIILPWDPHFDVKTGYKNT